MNFSNYQKENEASFFIMFFSQNNAQRLILGKYSLKTSMSNN